MRIYIDFDDVICETAKYFTKIAKDLFDIDVPYREVQFFNLQKSFDLTDDQYDELMRAGHIPANLLAYEETPDASQTINKWVDEGHEVSIVTGRPFDSFAPSRQWLDRHNLERVPLFCVDKYGRESFNQDCTYSMTLAQLYSLTFDFAIEDSPAAFEHVMHFENCKVAVFNRPWNMNAQLPSSEFIRCEGWKYIDELFQAYVKDSRIARIKVMEEKFDIASSWVADLDSRVVGDSAPSGIAPSGIAPIPEIDELIKYYESDLWRQDYDADSMGLLPSDLKRGVLSQDGIYNLLSDYQRLLNDLPFSK